MKILVIGATGTVGRHLLPALQAKGHMIRALTRNAAKAEVAPEGIEVRVGDLEDPMGLEAAFEGIEAVFLLNALSLSETQQGLVALEWTKRARAVKIVYLSVLGADDAPHIPHFGSKGCIERAIRKSGIDYTILQPSNFFQNDHLYRDAILEYGLYAQPLGSAGVNLVDTRDVADAAANAFTDPWASNGTFIVAGSEALTTAQIASTYSQALGSGVAPMDDLDNWQLESLATHPDWLVFNLRLMYEWIQRHGMRVNPGDQDRTDRLMGHSPRRYAAFVGEAVKSWASRP